MGLGREERRGGGRGVERRENINTVTGLSGGSLRGGFIRISTRTAGTCAWRKDC